MPDRGRMKPLPRALTPPITLVAMDVGSTPDASSGRGTHLHPSSAMAAA